MLAVAFGLALTLLAFTYVRQATQERLAGQFERETNNLEMTARQRIDNHMDVLYSLRDYFDAEGTISREAFGTFARGQLSRHSGIQALEWVPVVRDADRAKFEAAARREGLSGFQLIERDARNQLVPAGRRDVYYPVFYVEPHAGNERALGYAPALPARDEAIARAMDTARPAATAGFPIVQSVTGDPGVAVFIPVYTGGRAPDGVEARRSRMRGLVEGVVVPAEMLEPSLLEAREAGIAISLIDESAPPGQQTLLASRHGGEGGMRRDVPVEWAGRRWRLTFSLVDERQLAGVQGLAWLVLVGGLAATGLLGGYLSSVLTRRARVEAMVIERTRDLRHEKELAQTYLDVAAVMIVMLDPAGRVTLINRQGGETLGQAQEDIVGRDWVECFVPEPDRIEARRRAAAVSVGPRRPVFYEGRVVTASGEERLIAWHTTALFDEHGQAIAVLSSGADVTDYKRAIEEVAARRAELEKAQEVDKLKNTFASSVSHDLRTPLTSIMGYAEFLEDEIGGPLTAQQHGYVIQIMRGAKRLEHLVDDLLDFARIDAGTFHLRREPADLAAEIQEVTESLGPQIDEAGLTLAIAPIEDPLVAPMDTARIQRVLFNLLHNAIKFTPTGGTITVRARREGDSIRCEVIDTGIGIAEDQIPKLFQRFSQLKSGSEKGGTGLGLSICRAIVDAHGGDIGVKSAPGRGSTFWFCLPAEEG
ncbi:Non-motile and phage-resistance protein [compost metagenome]